MDAGILLLPEFAARDVAAIRPRGSPRKDTALDHPTVAVRRLVARATLFAPGDTASELYEVVRGTVMVSRTAGDGRRQIVDIVGRGRLFGFAGSDRHDCTAIALTATVVCTLDQQAARRHPLIGERLDRAARAEIHRLRDLALLLGRMTALERVASFFLGLIGDEAAVSARIALPVTRAEIADHLGLTIETVSRNITKLKRLGILGEDRGETITLTDREGLREVALGVPS